MPRQRPTEDAVREQLRAEDDRAGSRPTTSDGADATAGDSAGGDRDAVKGPRQEPALGHELDPAEPAGEGDPEVERELESQVDRPDPAEHDRGSGAAGESDSGETTAEAGAGGASEPESDPLAKAEAERDKYLELAQRTQADFENYRKRAARDAAAAGERARAGLVRDLLPVVDNLERALSSARAEEDHLAEGVRLVHAELVGVLSKSGVEPFDPSGEAFDPNLHEALSTRPDEGGDSGRVLEVVQKGYKAGETVLRPARVVVSA